MLGLRCLRRRLPGRCPLLCGRGDGGKPEKQRLLQAGDRQCPLRGVLRGLPPDLRPAGRTLGTYLELLSAKAAFEIPHRESGGAVTAILANALDLGLIDAVVTVTEDPWTLKPSSAVITKSDVLIHEAG